ncbi:hypothetical protein FP2506_16039 [Fulvimarina pelagi HTCC2506]|uniref:Uncharacterized protein n=1 Tax=Fulvimarina pelagi HTCC2506 TaxID=314231 RepID=Q0G372_9HYPH|nr:hypothetical protein FP2506_16039 [Fulvimarina pelagi HTCC2506]
MFDFPIVRILVGRHSRRQRSGDVGRSRRALQPECHTSGSRFVSNDERHPLQAERRSLKTRKVTGIVVAVIGRIMLMMVFEIGGGNVVVRLVEVVRVTMVLLREVSMSDRGGFVERR